MVFLCPNLCSSNDIRDGIKNIPFELTFFYDIAKLQTVVSQHMDFYKCIRLPPSSVSHVDIVLIVSLKEDSGGKFISHRIGIKKILIQFHLEY